MLKKIKKLLLQHLLSVAAEKYYKKVYPNGRIPRGGDTDKIKAVDCFAIEIMDGGQPWLLVENIRAKTLECLAYDKTTNQFKAPKIVRIENVDKGLHIFHYWGVHTIVFYSPLDYLLTGSTGWIYLKAKTEEYWQSSKSWLFNKRKLASQERYKLLKKLVDKHLKSQRDIFGDNLKIDELFIMNLLYTSGWVSHPQGEQQRKKVRLLLDSFVQSQELAKDANGKYSLTGKAIISLENYDNEERKHRENARIQLTIAFLTAGLFVAALIDLVNSLCNK